MLVVVIGRPPWTDVVVVLSLTVELDRLEAFPVGLLDVDVEADGPLGRQLYHEPAGLSAALVSSVELGFPQAKLLEMVELLFDPGFPLQVADPAGTSPE